jgi:hypothetical protein
MSVAILIIRASVSEHLIRCFQNNAKAIQRQSALKPRPLIAIVPQQGHRAKSKKLAPPQVAAGLTQCLVSDETFF